MSNEYTTAQIVAELLLLDEEVGLEIVNGNLDPPSERFEVILLGGSVFLIRSLTVRQISLDADFLRTDRAIREIVSRHPLLNNRVSAYIDELPYNFEDRLKELPLDTSNVKFLAPSNEDLAVMKLYAWRDVDITDLTSPQFLSSLDWLLLDKLVYEEAPLSRGCNIEDDRRYKEMCSIYEQYKDEYKRTRKS